VIDQWSDDRTGWARFSANMTMRYRLARSLPLAPGTQFPVTIGDTGAAVGNRRVVFLLLNPSTADAFEPDPTVTECRKRATALGADILEVVNLIAIRSPFPTDLRKRAHGSRGDDAINNGQIIAACTGAHLVIAGWGNDGALDHRDIIVRSMLRSAGIELCHLGTTQGGFPKHPLARGRHRIPADQLPIAWSTT
jgi:hypothetical protein